MKNKATWIWYPGDFEVWLGNKFNNRRTERGAMFPPFWKQDSHWPTVVFTKAVDLVEPETVTIITEGQTNLSIDGKLMPVGPVRPLSLTVPAGEHTLALKVWNQATPPALFLDGETVKSDGSWQVTYEDKIWIDENGEAHGSGVYVPVGSWNLDSPDTPPSQFHLPVKPLRPVGSWTSQAAKPSGDLVATNAALYDFGRETFGYLRIHGLRGTVRVYYGESREEALDTEHCETLDILQEGRTLESKAFRYVFVVKEDGATYDDVSMDYEYAPFDPEKSGSFRCNDDELNRIWEVAAYTLDLTTREFFCDGIKRDRWVWSGDAIQSYLMNYYLRFDTECVKRTIRQLRGKDPVTTHVNTIMDYTFYWFISIYDFYRYVGDLDFVREVYPGMVTLMDYVLGRTNDEGLAEGKPDDWIFVDWTDFPMHKRGALCFEQMLFWRALDVMTVFSMLLQDQGRHKQYLSLCDKLGNLIREKFWDNREKAFLHAIEDGQMNRQITRFPNIFAIFYSMIPEGTDKRAVTRQVLLNPDVPPITTPYMRFYEMEALCRTGQHEMVLRQMKDYWGGMLREGATTFWEKYNPEEHGTEHLAMYGRPYGKSLCHAWGASPIYIIGGYFFGVRPTKPGYEEYEVCPVLGSLEWMEGQVPTPFGLIRVKMNRQQVTVYSDGGKGILTIGGHKTEIPPQKEVTIQL